ncbi:LOW QUALITY PROTEIN: hypothetical protein V1478_005609 [Vespula squamosa]|uniref:Uncharacterized protein n=1 Tax=Vespula squamosa TaxID=30214 RepID=A0ABD2BAM5_VESSQ
MPVSYYNSNANSSYDYVIKPVIKNNIVKLPSQYSIVDIVNYININRNIVNIPGRVQGRQPNSFNESLIATQSSSSRLLSELSASTEDKGYKNIKHKEINAEHNNRSENQLSKNKRRSEAKLRIGKLKSCKPQLRIEQAAEPLPTNVNY